jgi:hypothetical protein
VLRQSHHVPAPARAPSSSLCSNRVLRHASRSRYATYVQR